MTPPIDVADLLARALDAYDALTALGEDVEDEWTYVNDLSSAWRERIGAVAAMRAGDPAADDIVAAVDRLIDEVGRISDPHRAIDWLSTYPQVVLTALGGAAMRFQDAVKDARSVVYAGIQADPLVARAAGLLADATAAQRVLARAVMNGELTDADGWRTMFPTLFAADADAAVLARSQAILDTSLEIAERGEQVRSQFRALVEELTAVLLARRVGADSVRRERRVLFDGVRSEVHPYDVTVERQGGAEVLDCKWGARGINADVLHQLDDARGHAAEEDEAIRVSLVAFDAARSCQVRLDQQTAPSAGTTIVTLESLDRLATSPGGT